MIQGENGERGGIRAFRGRFVDLPMESGYFLSFLNQETKGVGGRQSGNPGGSGF